MLLGVEYGDLGAALGRLSPEMRAVVQATVLDGLTSREAGRLLGIPENTVKTRLQLLVATLATATALRRAGHDAPGELVAAGVGGLVVLSMAVGAVPGVGPLLESADPWSRGAAVWVVLTVVGVVAILWGGSDPLTRWGRAHRRRP